MFRISISAKIGIYILHISSFRYQVDLFIYGGCKRALFFPVFAHNFLHENLFGACFSDQAINFTPSRLDWVNMKTGDKAPEFTLVNQDMKKVSLSDYKGKNVVLAFYPGAFTSVCKKEMCTIRDDIAKLEDLGAQVLGISVNDPFSQKAFHEDNVLNFPLLCDYNREVVKKYDVYHENFAGLQGYTAAKRSVFIIDGAGVIRYMWVSENPGVEPDYDEIKNQLSTLA